MGNKLQVTKNNVEIYSVSSQQLMECVINLGSNDTNVSLSAKRDLIDAVGEIMPNGRPDYGKVMMYPTIGQLVAKNGRKTMITVVYLLILDLCNSLNLKRNMSDAQILESASMLVDECGNYRLEDYVVMFTMAKRGKLDLKLYEGLDMLKIAEIEKSYNRYSTEQLYELERRIKTTGLSPAAQLEESETSFVSPETISVALKEFINTQQAYLDHQQEAEVEQRRWETERQQEELFQRYCKANNLDPEETRKEFSEIQQRNAKIATDYLRKNNAA